MFAALDENNQTFGYIKDAVDESLVEKTSSKEHIDYVADLNALSEQVFGRKAADFQRSHKIPFFRRDYWDWDLSRPANHTDPEWSDGDGGPSGVDDIDTDVEDLRKQQTRQDHPCKTKAQAIREIRARMAKTKTATMTQAGVTTNSGGQGGGGGGGGGSSSTAQTVPASSAPVFQQTTQIHCGRNGGDPPDGDDGDDSSDSSRSRSRKKHKKSRRRKRRHSSSSSSSSRDRDRYWFKCKSSVCGAEFKTKAERNAHLDECQLYYGDGTKTAPWGWAGTDMNKYRVTFHQRRFPEFVDDNLNALHRFGLHKFLFFCTISLSQGPVAVVSCQPRPGLCCPANRSRASSPQHSS